MEIEWRKLERKTIQICRVLVLGDAMGRAAALAPAGILLFVKTATSRTNQGRTRMVRVCGYLFSTRGRRLSLMLPRHA